MALTDVAATAVLFDDGGIDVVSPAVVADSAASFPCSLSPGVIADTGSKGAKTSSPMGGGGGTVAGLLAEKISCGFMIDNYNIWRTLSQSTDTPA